ncbi:MAG: RIP metalloprotease RseP [Candidatus Moraniibacteriota bacterium]
MERRLLPIRFDLTMLTILIFVLILGLLVFVHELGHFITARRNGIKADEFGFGFPPRLVGFVKEETTGKYKIIWGNQHVESPQTVYSINWIPLGGFVRIKGEDPTGEEAHDPDSFAGKSAWVRLKVLGAGVVMNFLLAWLLFSVVLTIGFPQQVSPAERSKFSKTDVQILQVVKGSPAETMGLQPGDLLLKLDTQEVANLEMVSQYINGHAGEKISLTVTRGGTISTLSGVPRKNHPEGEGPLGISFSETAVVSYPWYLALWEGLRHTYGFTIEILTVFGTMIAGLFTGTKAQLDVAGPVGIIYLTKQMSELGFVYLIQFAAVLSINLGIINALPIPALDGGRMLFVIIEKLKGSPVSRKVEGYIHQFGFIALLLLMVIVTFHDLWQFNIWGKIQSLF